MTLLITLFLVAVSAGLLCAQSIQDQLSAACKKGDLAAYQQLVRRGAHPLEPDSKGKNPLDYLKRSTDRLKWAEIAGRIHAAPTISTLVESPKPEPMRERVDPRVDRLCDAADRGDLATVRRILSDRVDVDARGSRGYTALMEASFRGHYRVVGLLLDSGADVNRTESKGHRTALLLALNRGSDPEAARNCLIVAETLLKAGANVEHHFAIGITPLMCAAREGDLELVALLLRHGADPKATDPDGRTALQYAQEKGHSQVVRALAQTNSRP